MAVLEYTLSSGEATLTGVSASSGRIALPEELDGYSLTHLGAYCLSARRVEPSQPVLETTVGEPDPFGRADQPVYGGALIALSLPQTVQELGSHCCYGCTHLEELSFYDGLEYVSDGAFKNCRSLSRITLYAPKGSTAALEGVLSQISGFCEVEIRFPQQTVPLIFPGYSEEWEENCPARIFSLDFNGTGYQYRQCLSFRGLDWERYDSLFPTAANNEALDVLLPLVWRRLKVPYALQEKAKARYLDWTQHHLEAMTRWLLEQKQPFFGPYLQWGLITPENAELLRSLSAQYGDTETVSALLDWQKQRRPGWTKEYDL